MTKGQRRKLNALRKSVGDEIGEQAFAAWLSSQSTASGAKSDENAALIVDTLWPLVQEGTLAIPRSAAICSEKRPRPHHRREWFEITIVIVEPNAPTGAVPHACRIDPTPLFSRAFSTRSGRSELDRTHTPPRCAFWQGSWAAANLTLQARSFRSAAVARRFRRAKPGLSRRHAPARKPSGPGVELQAAPVPAPTGRCRGQSAVTTRARRRFSARATSSWPRMATMPAACRGMHAPGCRIVAASAAMRVLSVTCSAKRQMTVRLRIGSIIDTDAFPGRTRLGQHVGPLTVYIGQPALSARRAG